MFHRLPPSVHIFFYTQPIDGRKGIDSLAALVQSACALDPLTGHLFVFLAGRGHYAHILIWDHNGFVLYSKRLARERFYLPRSVPEGTTHFTFEAADLVLLLEGIDLRSATRRPRWQPPASAPQDLPACGDGIRRLFERVTPRNWGT